MPRHFDGALAEGVGNCALVATALAKDDGESIPQPVWGQARTDKPVLFELLSQLAPCGTEVAQSPRGAPGIGTKCCRHMIGRVVENIRQRGWHGPENWLSGLGPACCNLAAFRELSLAALMRLSAQARNTSSTREQGAYDSVPPPARRGALDRSMAGSIPALPLAAGYP